MSRKITNEVFICDSRQAHGDKYDYSLVEYDSTRTKVKIICPEHGIFEQLPLHHKRGHGCKKCAVDITHSQQKLSLEEFIEKAKQVHGDKYDYSLVEYVSNKTKVKIICPEHGVFEQKPNSHINKRGCRLCAGNIKKTLETFIKESDKAHKNKYDYSQTDYKGKHTKIVIICPVHGEFEQLAGNHLYLKNGCPICSYESSFSRGEQELQEWLSQHIDIITNNRSLIYPYELDIVIPSRKIAVEYNGLYWHSEQRGKDKKYHLNKYNLCKEKGYRLIQIWENEWLFKKDIVKSILLSALGIYERKLGARQCEIKDVDVKDARIFYNSNHIQGFKGGKHKGLYYNNELVSLMTIEKSNILERFANKINTQVYGAFSKLLKSFEMTGKLTTFSDLRYFTGDVYRKNGFEYQYDSAPNFWYLVRNKMYSRICFQKHKLKNKLSVFDDNLTAYQNMLNNGYDRIWDCGNMKFIKYEQQTET